jgi:hypothetical protein
MKIFFCSVILLLVLFPVWTDISLNSSFDCTAKDEELVISGNEDLRLSGGERYPWSCSLFLDIQPPPRVDQSSRSQTEWGASFLTPYTGLGRLVLSGAYDRLESTAFPSFYSWDRPSYLTFEKGKVFNDRWGGALHDRDKRVICHYLETPEYSQRGIFFDLGDNYLGWEGGLLHTSLEGDIKSDTSWYDPDQTLYPEELVHGQGTLKYGFHLFDSLWLWRCEGAVLLPQTRKRAFRLMASLFCEQGHNSILILGGFHSGPWLSCAGKETAWQQGAGLRVSLFEDRLVRVGADFLLFYSPDKEKPGYEGKISLKHDFLCVYGQTEYDSPNHLTQWEGGSTLTWKGNKGFLEGEGVWLYDKKWQQTLTLRTEGGDLITLSGEASWIRKNMARDITEDSKNELRGEMAVKFPLSSHWEGETTFSITVGGKNWEIGEWILSGGIGLDY